MRKNKKKELGILALTVLVTMTPVVAQAGTWKQNSTGWWWQEADGSYPASEWKTIGEKKYYFDQRGYMKSGWYKEGNAWYYLGTAGDGAMKTGWQKVNGAWYYMNEDGKMATGWKKIGANWYYLNSSGAMQTGWLKTGDAWYYLGVSGDGSMKTGWQQINGKWYYMYSDGKMAADTWIGSSYVNRSGAWIPNAVSSRWVASGDRWWYRHPDGSYTVNGWETINNKTYYFDSQGWMQTGWRKIDGNWYYLGPVGDGVMRKDQWAGDYYLGSDGKMLTSCWVGDCYVGVSGKYETNTWVQDFYVGSDGNKLRNQWIDDCYVGEDGKKKTSQWIGDSYVGTDGKMVRNAWIDDYYVGTNGTKLKDTWVNDRYLGPDGKWDKTKPVRVPLERVRISGETGAMKQGEKQKISWQYFPENTTDDLTAKWTSSDDKVASVEDGIVTAHAAGKATITLKVGGCSEKYNLVVLPEDTSDLSLQIKYPTEGASCLKYGERAEAAVIMQPGNIHIETYGWWSVDDADILEVNSPVGYLVSKGVGETTVHVRFGDIELSSKVRVEPPEENIEEFSFDKTTLQLEKRQTGQILLTTKPAQYAWSAGVKWRSTDESVATVNDYGTVTALKPGTTTVYAELLGHRAECEVIVAGQEDVIEYSYDTDFAKDIFDEINRMRTANGVEPFIWKEDDAVYASKLRAGVEGKDQKSHTLVMYQMENEETHDVQLLFRDENDFGEQIILDKLKQNAQCLASLLKNSDQPLTAGCAAVVKKVDGEVQERAFVFTIGPSESELGKYPQKEREEYWANWIEIPEEKVGDYLF